ncbi:Extracellular serine-rich protein [Apiospora rasikravindrae]|uniref:Extracellular serine-rich protein n=1 Tax=Apiospora rasikravindrae TaxID=990691 RepID=A0ABR1SLM6_9PEZI
MQFSMSLAVFAAAVSALPQPLATRKEQEPRVMSPQEAAHEALKAAGLRKGDFGTEAAAKIIPVIIGGQQVTMVPNLVTAAVGDIVQFQFANGNHTVTQSSETAPCTPLQNSLPGAVHSGHIPFNDGQTTVGTFNMPVLTTEPMFIYCATGPHCQLGQMMVINPKTADQVVQYFKVSNQAKANVDAKTVAGGTVAQIPLAQAAFQPAPPEDKGKGGAAPPRPLLRPLLQPLPRPLPHRQLLPRPLLL